MTRFTKKTATVALHIIRDGLRMEPRQLTRQERQDILEDAERLIEEGHEPDDLVKAARFGMHCVWPFSEGQSWDSSDFRENITKAKSAASRLREAGKIPVSAEET